MLNVIIKNDLFLPPKQSEKDQKYKDKSSKRTHHVTNKILIQITKKKKDIAINFHTNLFTIQHIRNPLCNLFLVKFNPPIYQLHMRTIVEHIITTSLRFKVKGKFFINSQCQI